MLAGGALTVTSGSTVGLRLSAWHHLMRPVAGAVRDSRQRISGTNLACQGNGRTPDTAFPQVRGRVLLVGDTGFERLTSSVSRTVGRVRMPDSRSRGRFSAWLSGPIRARSA